MKRKQTAKTTGTVYDSVESAAAALQVEKSLLQKFKRQGCPAFRGSRVYEDEFNEWLKSRGIKLAEQAERHVDKRQLECDLLIERITAARLDIEQQKSLLMPRAEHEAWLTAKAEQLKANLRDILIRQLPPKLEGLRAAEIVVKMEEAIVEFVNRFRKPPETAT